MNINETQIGQSYNIQNQIDIFQKANNPEDRNSSFDYCYNYFKNSSANELEQDMEKSCLVLGFYLASWGMLRGSSFLLQKSVKYYENLIKYIIELKKEDNSIFEIDVDKYNDVNIEKILKVYEEINSRLDNKASCILRTKIMLGVFGCIPAFDTYFKSTFKKLCDNKCKFNKVDKNALEIIKLFYNKNRNEIDLFSSTLSVKCFNNQDIKYYYPKAKIIDMYGFQSALGKAMYQKIQKKKRK